MFFLVFFLNKYICYVIKTLLIEKDDISESHISLFWPIEISNIPTWKTELLSLLFQLRLSLS